MLNINYISETFFNCCNIPIKTISKDYKEIDKYGYNDYMDKLYPKDKIENFIEIKIDNNKDIHTLSIENDIHYIIKDACNIFLFLVLFQRISIINKYVINHLHALNI